MRCLQLSIPAVQKDLKELSSIFKNENLAYALLAKNNGYNLDLTPEGNPSSLFEDLVKTEGSRKAALKTKAIAYTPDFLNGTKWIGQGEPQAQELLNFKEENSRPKINIGKYDSKSVPHISATVADNKTIGAEVTKAITQGVRAFTMNKVDKLNIVEEQIRNYLIDDQNFEYSEVEDVGYYTKKLTETQESMSKVEGNTLRINNVEINLKKLGIDFTVTRDQLKAVQEAADWIKGRELKQRPDETYTGKITELGKGEIFVFASESRTKAESIFGRDKDSPTGFKAKAQGKQSYGLDTTASRSAIVNQISKLYQFASSYPAAKFKVATPVEEDLAQMFVDAGNIPSNVVFEKEFSKLVYDRTTDMTDANFLLTGYAGTGKTAVTNIIIEYAQQSLVPIAASAITSRAVRVQREMYGNRIDTGTLHSMLGLRPDISIEEFSAKNVQFSPQARPLISPGSILIVDESSMTNDSLYDFLISHSKEQNYRILFIGDNKQFKPVKQRTVSKVFSGQDKFIARLTTQVRQTPGNTLGATLNKLRVDQKTTTSPLGDDRTSSINDTKTEGIEWTNRANFMDHIDKLFVSDNFTKDPYFARVIAYKNATVSNYNLHIRKLLGKQHEVEVGEILTGYQNVSDFQRAIIENGADYIVTAKKDVERTFIHPTNKDIKVPIFGTEVSLKDASLGQKTSTFIMSVNNSEDTKIAVAKMAYESLQEYFKVRGKEKKLAKTVYAKYKSFLNSFQTFEDLTIPGISDRTGKPTIHKPKSIDYGYAITSHKSQGGTYQYVFADEADIESIYSFDVEAANQSKYVAFSRAAKGVIANTRAAITNRQGFEFKTEGKVEDVSIADHSSATMEALIKDGIIHKTCD